METDVNGKLKIELDTARLFVWFEGEIITSQSLFDVNVTFNGRKRITIGKLTLLRSWLSDEMINAILERLK